MGEFESFFDLTEDEGFWNNQANWEEFEKVAQAHLKNVPEQQEDAAPMVGSKDNNGSSSDTSKRNKAVDSKNCEPVLKKQCFPSIKIDNDDNGNGKDKIDSLTTTDNGNNDKNDGEENNKKNKNTTDTNKDDGVPGMKSLASYTLSKDQRSVLDAVLLGHNVFFTGSAGTGKSFLLGTLITCLRQKYGKESVGVTAATGIAATHIGGTTLHAFCKTGINYQR